MKDQRVVASSKLPGPNSKYSGDKKQFITSVHDALHASKICSYAQGMGLIRAGSDEYKWGIDLKEMARIWKGGCIIRATLLDAIMQAYEKQPNLPNLLLDERGLDRRRVRTTMYWRHGQAEVVLHPSTFEGFGLPMLEGMAVGTPFLSTEVGAAEDLAVDPRQVLPPDPAAWLEALDVLRRERPDWGALSRERAAQFSWASSAEALLQATEENRARPRSARRAQ